MPTHLLHRLLHALTSRILGYLTARTAYRNRLARALG
jgi:hypothetical protein